MNLTIKNLLFRVIVLGVAACTPLLATTVPITIVNAGFENPVLSNGASTNLTNGWSIFGNVELIAAWNPDSTYYPSGAAPEGANIGDVFLSSAFSGCSQVLQGAEGQFQADTSYDLKVKVGRNLSDTYDGYIVQLVVNGTMIAQDDNTLTPAAGSFVATSVKYAYNAALHSGLVGYPIEIRLLSKGLAGGYGDVNFDDVQLTYETLNPVAKHGGPYRLSEGASLSLNGSASIPSSGGSSIQSYAWDLDGDGDFDENVTSATPTILYANLITDYGMELGANTIRLSVTDNANQTSISSTTVTIYPLRTYIGPNTSNGNTERWNVATNWNIATVPSGLVDVLIPDSKNPVPCNSSATPTFTGNLTMGINSQISFGWTSSGYPVYNAMGTPGSTIITMNSGSSFSFRVSGSPIIPAIVLNGNASITLGSSTQPGAKASFNYPITGNYRFSLYGNSTQNCVANFNTPNTFNEIYTAGAPYVDGGVTIAGNAPGSLGTGNLTLNALTGGGNSGIVVINAENAMADSATLSTSGNSATKITMNANDTIARLVINGAQMPAGTYGSSTSSATFKQTWITGNAILTVTDGEASYWDINGATTGAGGATPTGTWDSGSTLWSNSTTGTETTASWVSGRKAVFAAGSDATGNYTVTIGGSNAISVTNSFTASNNTGSSSFNVTKAGWTLNSGNCVAVLISSLNATGFTATYAGQPMTVQGVYDSRNSYTGIAYIIGDSLPATGDVVISIPRIVPAINTGAYANMGTVYSILSLSNVASPGTAVTKVQSSGNASMTYSTSVNNSFVVGVASDSNWSNSLKTVVGTCSTIISRAKPAYFNTIQCYGSVGVAKSYTDTYSPSLTALITLPFNAKSTSNPLLAGEGQKISGVEFEEGAVTVSGSKLELQTNSPFNSASGVTGTVASQISGLSSAGLIKKGPGTVLLSNSTNNYSGVTTINNGILRLGAHTALPNTEASLSGDAPGVTASLDLNGYNATVAGLTFGGSSSTSGSSITTGAGTLTLSGNVAFNSDNSPLGGTLAGKLSLGSATRTFDIRDSSSATNDLAVSAVISGSGGLTKIGFGTLSLSGNNTFTGTTMVNDGLLVLSGSNSAATGGITVNNNGAVRFETLTAINGTGQNVTIASGGVAYFGASFGVGNIPAALARIAPASAGVVAVDNYNSTAFNFSTNNLNAYLGAQSDVTYTGAFTPSGAYRIGGGTGTITLTGANALTGAGSLLIGGKVVIANSNNITGATTINTGGRLQIGTGGAAGSLSSTTITNNGTLAFSRSDTFTQGTNFWAAISGDGIVEKTGSGTLILNGNNSYGGGTNLVSGTLKIEHENAIGSGPLSIYSGVLDTSSALTLATNNAITLGGNFSFGGTANLNMGMGVVNAYGNPIITLGGTASILTFGGVISNISGGDQTITVNGAGNTLVLGGYEMSSDIYASNIAIMIGGSGNVSITGPVNDWTYIDPELGIFDLSLGSLTKTGTGTLTLSGNNNYTGNTVVAGGVLHLASGSQISPIIVNNGGTLGFNLGNIITSSESLTLNPGHKIRIVGTIDTEVDSYTLMTCSSILGGSPTLETAIPGYILEVAGKLLKLSKSDGTPPLLAETDIVDDKGGGPVLPNTLVTYTLSFNEDIDHNSVTSADFDNAGSSTITIGTITEISPGIFTVQVTPTTEGTLQLRIPTTAQISDTALTPNFLVSNPAIADNTSITVETPNLNWLVASDIVDDKAGAAISQNTLVTYTLYFSKDIDLDSVSSADFKNAGSSVISIGTITEIAPGVITVKITPTTIGTLQLQIPTTATISDGSNNMDVDPSILDNTTIIVANPYSYWAGVETFDTDTNGDGVANGLAWLLGATDVNQNANALLPTADESSGDLYLGFTTLNATARGTASIKVQYSNDMGVADPWGSHEAEVPTTTGVTTVNDIEFNIEPLEGDYISVLARIPATAAGTGKKLFSRIKGVSPLPPSP